MNREEILSKSREENKNGDERVRQVEARAGSLAFRLGGTLCILLVAFMRITTHWEQSPVPLWTLYSLMVASNQLYVGVQLKSKGRLFVGVLWGLLCVACLTILVLECTGVLPRWMNR